MVNQICDLFDKTTPKILLDERERFLERGPLGSEEAAEPSSNLSFNQEACFTKCIVQLLLIGAVQEIVERFYDAVAQAVSIEFF